VRRQNIIGLAALAGTVGPIVLDGTLLALSVLEYDFMVGIRSHPARCGPLGPPLISLE
jgi:hypothetical protein